jgi:adrenodoxin-NADP+ reductase
MSVARVCIVGAGPSGMYTAKYLLKSLSSSIMLDIYESLPTPFGLVRSGVAPDHPHTKSVVNEFNAILQDQRVRFIGNCQVENVDQVLGDYSAVVVCTGANDDKCLGIEGEFMDGVYSARKFVNWYNGYPSKDFKEIDLEFREKLKTSQVAVVVGQGNVAVDIARILLQPKKRLESTDMCASALQALENSAVRKVYLVGRRGPVQVTKKFVWK